jgi:flagellar basal body rod protein FlgG
MRLTTDQVTIAPNGEIRNGDELVGQLQVTRFDASARFEYVGDGLMKTNSTSLPVEKDAIVLRQGFLEASNVKPLQDMLGVMETSRHFDLAKNGLTAYDSMLDDAINRLGSS